VRLIQETLPFSAVELYEKAILMEWGNEKLPASAYPTLHTLDGFQGKESRVVIVDLVFSSSRSKFEMGMVLDEYRAVIGSTRARDFLIIVVNMSFASGVFADESEYRFWKQQRRDGLLLDEDEDQDEYTRDRLPFFNNYANLLRDQRKIYKNKSKGSDKYIKFFDGGRYGRSFAGGTWVAEGFLQARNVITHDYRNPQHERDEMCRDVLPLAGAQ
jgi:hypothetical protein